MVVSAYTLRSARPPIGPEPVLVRVRPEPREPVVPVFLLTELRPGVVRVERRMAMAAWKRVAQ